MNHLQRFRSAAQRASWARGAGSIVLLFSLPVATAAQSTRVVASTTDDVPAAVGLPFSVADGDLVTIEPGMPVTPFFAGGHFQATCGFVPGDIDAFTRLPGSRPGSFGSMVFSLLSNEGAFLDGDVLILTNGGGASLLVSELDFANALGASGANIDVAAVTYDDQGRVVFSLADNLAASAVGPVADGDVLRLEPGLAGVTRLLSEADVQARFTLATGMTDAILDVQALEWSAGEMWASVQSPTRHDGSVIALEGSPHVVYDENDLGLGGAELDALGEQRAGDELPVCHLSLESALPGDLLHIETRGSPGARLIVFMSGGTGFVNVARFPGFGGLYVDRFDPWLNALLGAHALPYITL